MGVLSARGLCREMEQVFTHREAVRSPWKNDANLNAEFLAVLTSTPTISCPALALPHGIGWVLTLLDLSFDTQVKATNVMPIGSQDQAVSHRHLNIRAMKKMHRQSPSLSKWGEAQMWERLRSLQNGLAL